MPSLSESGMTLVEVLIATLLFVGGGGALLFGMHYAMIHADYLRQVQVATNMAQGRLEELESMPFDSLTTQAGTMTFGLPGDPAAIRATQVQAVTPNLMDLHVAVCWRHRRRQIGEMNGATACQDSGDAGWWVDSPAMVSTRVARRD